MSNDNRDKFYEDEQRKSNENQQAEDSEVHKQQSSYRQERELASEDAEYTSVDNVSTSNQEAAKPQGPTYYTYGQTRPMGTVQPHYQATSQPSANYPYGTTSHSSETAPQSYSQYGGVNNYGAVANHNPVANGQAPNHVPYRQFTTSTVGGDPLAAKKEKQRSGGFGKIGLLMYTADVQNWFSKDVPVTQSNTYNSGSTSSSGNPQGTTSSLTMDRPDNISQLFSSSSPAVVKIETYSQATRGNGSSLFDDPFFRQFFGNNAPKVEEKQSTELMQTGMGTGFFFESTGYILTNQHVVSDSNEIRVIVEGYDEPFTATLLGSSYQLDLAVLKVEGEKAFPTLPLGNSNDTQIGDWVLAIGNPYGFDHTLTVGVISAKERPIDISDTDGTRNYKNLLQTDASINPGNSGGPLLNMNGEVIGINTAVSSTAQGIGFAIPTSTITEVLESLKSNTPVAADASPFIGAELQDLTESLAAQLGLSQTDGTIVRSVYYNSPAYKGGLKQYDVIIGVDDKPIKTMQELIDYIQEHKVGDTIELSVIRDGENIQLSVEIGDKNQFGL
jgi:serine protease Do